MNGTRNRSTLSPSAERIAGRTVSEPITATATTIIVATPKGANPSPAKSKPPIATMTIAPEMRTERPDVAAAISSASSELRPAARSSRSLFK